MHLLAISLLSILAGTLLLAKFKKEMPGKFFSFIAWFFIAVGFILFIGFVAGGICKLKHRVCGPHQSCQTGMMMKDCGPGMMHGCDRGMMHNCNPGMMNNCSHDMRGGGCGPRGMGHPGCGGMQICMPHDSAMKCCPEGMEMRKCGAKAECMPHDSAMKCCPKHVQGEAGKTPDQKK